MYDENYQKKYNPYLPNIRYNSQYGNEINYNYSKNFNNEDNSNLHSEKINYNNNLNSYKFYNEFEGNDKNENNSINKQLSNRNNHINNNKYLISDEKEYNYNYNNNERLPNVFISNEKSKENYFLKKNNSSLGLVSSNLSINNNSYENNDKELSNFIAKIKILNFYSTSEIILLIEDIISELNLKKDYTFSIKDNSMSFMFNNSEQALTIFKEINIKKLRNKYFQNLTVDIKFEIKKENEGQEQEKKKDEIKEEINKEAKTEQRSLMKRKILKLKPKTMLPTRNIRLQEKKMESFKNLKTYNYSKDNIMSNKLSDKYFENVYKNYLEYFRQRKIERRKRVLNYQNGKDISLLASSPYVENNNKKSFQDNLRKSGGSDIAPSKFNGFIDKASIKKDNYNENHLYLVPDFINHWKLREDDKKKWICPNQFKV